MVTQRSVPSVCPRTMYYFFLHWPLFFCRTRWNAKITWVSESFIIRHKNVIEKKNTSTHKAGRDLFNLQAAWKSLQVEHEVSAGDWQLDTIQRLYFTNSIKTKVAWDHSTITNIIHGCGRAHKYIRFGTTCPSKIKIIHFSMTRTDDNAH